VVECSSNGEVDGENHMDSEGDGAAFNALKHVGTCSHSDSIRVLYNVKMNNQQDARTKLSSPQSGGTVTVLRMSVWDGASILQRGPQITPS
jgi:hypothetical protein